MKMTGAYGLIGNEFIECCRMVEHPATHCGNMRVHRLRVACGLELAIHCIAFDASEFIPEAYERHGIACPPSVLRSVRARQAEYFHGRLAARAALAAMGAPLSDLMIGHSGQPVWPRGVLGSITHTTELAAAVAIGWQPYSGIGIDIEDIIGTEARAALIDMVVSPAELAYVRSLSGLLPMEVLLTTVFSAKESFFKAAFSSVGSYFDFSAAAATHIDVASGALRLTLTETLCAGFSRGQSLAVRFCLFSPSKVLTYCVC